jgi:hypothetical protein
MKKPAQPSDPHWRNRIIGTGAEDPKAIAANPLNFRIHDEVQAATMKGALDTIGWWQHVTINRSTGRLIDGHLRVGLACRDGEPTVPVSYVELSEAEEAAALASGDAIGAMAEVDSIKFSGLLDRIDVHDRALSDLFGSMMDNSARMQFTDIGGDREPAGERESSHRDLGDTDAQIKPVLYADDIAVFERAIRATGEINRGQALMTICRAYLNETKPEAKRQFDIRG